MIRSAKFILKPTKKQEKLLMVFFGMSRFAYNEVLYWIKESTFGTYEIKKGKNKGKIVSKIPSLMEIQGCSTIQRRLENECFTQSNA